MDRNIFLRESEIPQQWYNVIADLPDEVPVLLHPGTKQPLKKEELYPLLAKGLVDQEFSRERYFDIPERKSSNR